MDNEEKMTTTDGRSVDAVREEQRANPNAGQHKSYLILSDEERAKGYVRPVRRSYKHVGLADPKYPLRDLTPEEHARYDTYGYVKFEAYPPESQQGTGKFWTQAQLDKINNGCGSVTTMGQSIAETYARNPKFYGATFCVECNVHLPVGAHGEFVWLDNPDERVGT